MADIKELQEILDTTNPVIGIMSIITAAGILIILNGFLWTYSINTWLMFIGKESSILFWQGALLGFCPTVGKITIEVATITWILMLFLN